ncbi:peptidylprolyl isomerase [Sphingomonas sp. BK235]|jgi:parvulin-like peptidyl-prolyl isomerase|uniref:peptidylprolyl isomerase n=1 Tax=Sphingomonas sp. BK235 TaxID=2512131 RepID=UPI00104DEAF0|nr:peptidylprolyl isomerase [Sphingomonas sp. BK235]TCP37363.1 periplasmic chaperone for outer membrane proteins SurA [Sphingomonas sp. BK235]
MTKTRGVALTRRMLAALLMVGTAGVAIAQTAADQDGPEQGAGAVDPTGLGLPANLQVFGNVDPNIRKATAIVNETVITRTDVDQRVALIAAANNVKLSDQERERLQLQVLRQLIDETLEIQQAKTADVTITKDQIDQSFARVSRNFGKTPEQFATFLRENGSSDRSIRRQIEGELAWNKYLSRRVEPFVNVGDEEVKAILDRLEAAKGTEEFHLNEIYLSATPDRQEQVFTNARQLIAEIGKGQAPFAYFARNFSEASTRGVGGDLGWVRTAQLPEALAQAATTMQVGQVAGPVATPGGFSILYLVDKRRVGSADPRDARLSLKQMTIKFPANTTQTQATARTSAFAEAIQKLQGCGSVAKVAATLNAEVVDNDAIRIRDLPPPLQTIMVSLQVGQATPPFGSPTEGVRTLVLCGRDEASGGQLPGAQQVQSQLEQQRVNLRAQQALRDLRRDAVIEYR